MTDYVTRAEMLKMQREIAEFAERSARQFRSNGLAGITAVPEAPSVVIDISSPHSTFAVTLTGNRALAFTGGAAAFDRRKIVLEVTQGTTGGWLLTPDSSVAFSDDLPSISLSGLPGETDVLGFQYVHSTGKYRFIAITHGF